MWIVYRKSHKFANNKESSKMQDSLIVWPQVCWIVFGIGKGDNVWQPRHYMVLFVD